MRFPPIVLLGATCACAAALLLLGAGDRESPIHFTLRSIPFHLENNMTPGRNAPESMAGGVAIFDYNRDGRPDIFFTNGADIATLRKAAPKYRNRLFRNDGNGVFTDVTEQAGLAGAGYDIGAAVADYDNDGWPDLFVAGVHASILYHNNGDGTFTDVTKRALPTTWNDPQYGPLWAEGAVWLDVNNDGLLDLFVVNYMQWSYSPKPLCSFQGVADYCHPRYYKGQANQLFLNNGDGTFRDVSDAWRVRAHPGKGMSGATADYDLDGRPDIFVTNDAYYNSLFHNTGSRFEEVAMSAGVALAEDGNFISGMGEDFRDYNNDGYPDIVFAALNNQTFPLFRDTGKGDFHEATADTGLRRATLDLSGFGAALCDFDNDGWKDLFFTLGHVASLPQPGHDINEFNTVFRNPGAGGLWQSLGDSGGLNAGPRARHRGLALGDLDGDGRVDVVATALDKDAEMWMNASPRAGHWLDIALQGTKSNRDGIGARIRLTTKTLTQYNHMTTAVGYASSSAGPVHFGLGSDPVAQSVEIRWPSGIVQTLHDVPADRVVHVKEPAK
ncbi:MAG TPA: CRTAC1 family protein [Bryobacteraceae bacterium]|nr:CRTAC1 family protein [Bryobacteraceae bacterium]